VTDSPAPDEISPEEDTNPVAQPRGEPTSGPPPVHAGWAVTSLLFFWPLSFSAFTHAFNVYPLWVAGDPAAARYASDRVRRLGQLSLWLFGALLLLFVILYAIFAVVLITHGDGETPRHGFEHGRE
jgi:hypothetical protein